MEKLSETLNKPNIGPKDWWRTLRGFIKPNQSSTLPPLNKGGTTYSDDLSKANILNEYFTEQALLDESHVTLPLTNNIPSSILDTISVMPEEVELTLQPLQ
ncbi:MAG: hypothetical protein JAY75_14945, partial [Candidatus Thiodiazotropha taylori]|nr:hypothetical protein [Candidatus Thiodiazotropha taylori]MCW4309512.1 hypothetical protein [Candidatus Thiodiazotropha endolucinida]